MNKLISIVVPVYNCEKYLSDCINSIKSQTYKDYEVIIVLNGCTDNSKQICEELTHDDNRFMIIECSDADLSTARNTGISHAKGEYISFIDSDDYISPDFLSCLYSLISENDADIAICEYECVDEESHFDFHSTDHSGKSFSNGKTDIMESKQSVQVMDSEQIMNSFFITHKTSYVTVWNKLYKKSIWNDIMYPPHRKNEDEYVSYKALYSSGKTVLSPRSLYFYRQRSGSIMHTTDGKKYCDCIYAYNERTDFFVNEGKNDYAIRSCLSSLKWCTAFYYNICSGDSFSSIELKKLFDNAYGFICQNLESDIVKELPVIVLEFYKCFYYSPVKAHKIFRQIQHKEYKSQNSFVTVSKNSLRELKNNFRFNLKRTILFSYIKIYNPLHILNIEQSIDKLLKDCKGICRFGDGEMDIISGKRLGFQKSDEELAKRLRSILNDEHAPCNIAIPDEVNLSDYENQTMKSRRYWIWNMLHCRHLWIKNCSRSITYLTTNVTRPYMRFFDKSKSIGYFNKLRTLWDNKSIIIVEGSESRLGIGNDLFSKSEISRIICPKTDAFDFYDEILATLIKLPKDKPIFIALGPTATVLSYDLCKAGYMAYDIGHIDIEYEWMNMRTDSKVAVPSKFTNEADGGSNVDDCTDSVYLNQIIAKIGV